MRTIERTHIRRINRVKEISRPEDTVIRESK
jgi:hypothetical protein